MTVQALTSETFVESALSSKLPVLVEFGAAWCGPCRKFAPVLEKLKAEYAGVLDIFTVDVDANPDLAQQYRVLSMPSFRLFIGGDMFEIPSSQLTKTAFNEHLASFRITPAVPA